MGLAKDERAVLLGAIGAASGGAVRAGPEGVVSVEGLGAWGLCRVFSLRFPTSWGTQVYI